MKTSDPKANDKFPDKRHAAGETDTGEARWRQSRHRTMWPAPRAQAAPATSTGTRPPVGPLRGAWPCQHPDVGLLPSRRGRGRFRHCDPAPTPVPSKPPAALECGDPDSKILTEMRRAWQSQNNLEKQEQGRGRLRPHSETCQEATATRQRVVSVRTDRHANGADGVVQKQPLRASVKGFLTNSQRNSTGDTLQYLVLGQLDVYTQQKRTSTVTSHICRQ